MSEKLTLVSWNIGGVNYLKAPPRRRKGIKEVLNSDLMRMIEKYKRPHFILLQEIVKYEGGNRDLEEIIAEIPGYHYQSFIAIDTDKNNHPKKWDPIRASNKGNWSKSAYLGQGNGILWRNDIPHSPIWEANLNNAIQKNRIDAEVVRMDSGLYTGTRNTEPRIAVVSHFVLEERDIYLINLHLTTLSGEREGFPERDSEGQEVRSKQIDILVNGIVSRFNSWRAQHITAPSKKPIWILGGDFNATPDSMELLKLKSLNFLDLCPNKGSGTKRSKDSTRQAGDLTVDYIFAGIKYYAFNPYLIEKELSQEEPSYEVTSSDHFPFYAEILL